MSQSAVRQPIPVGKYFLDRGIITQQQLDAALQHRGANSLKLGQALVELGFVTESDMVEALRHQARFPCIHLTSGIVDARVAERLGEETSRRLKALALNHVAEHTTVALEDPSDPRALEELEHRLGTRVFPVYAEPSVILALIDQLFGGGKPAHDPRTGTRLGTEQAQARTQAATGPVDDRAVVEAVRGFLQQAFEQGASDVHLEARRDELVVRFRVHAALRAHARLPGSWAKPAIACLKALAQIDQRAEADDAMARTSAREGTIPFTYRKESYEVHVATLPTRHGESVVLHVRGGPVRRRELEHIGLAAEDLAKLEPILAARDGLLIVTGPAGSGCTTTLEALLARQATPERKIVALAGHGENVLEDVLYAHAGADLGLDEAARVHALLGQDPDLLVVPAITGREMARSLLDAAASRSVYTVLRARSALEALQRLVHLGLEPYLLADALRAVVGQRLVRRICQECKTPIVPDEALLERLALPHDGATYFEGEGCAACHGTGFSERLGLYEVLAVTGNLRHELERGAGPEALALAARVEGFVGLREHGLRQARAGLTTLHEVLVATSGV